MPGSERETRLKFLGLSEGDVTLLRALRPVFEKHVGTFADAFYGILADFPETAPLLRERTTAERLKAAQRVYLMRIVEGNFDDAYFADRQRIGHTHERVGLLPRWYLLAFSHCLAVVAPRVQEHYADQPELAHRTILALEKVFLLDASLSMDAYIASDRYRHMQFLQSIVRDTVDAIFLLDPDRKFRVWNPAAERMFGWTAAEVIGKTIHVIYPPDLIEAGEMQRMDADIEQAGHARLETERLAKDGRRVPVDLSVSVLRDPQGQVIGRCAILRDITERRRLEAAKIQSERLAVIGTMSAKLAHEIRNPLSSITLNMDLVRDELETLARANPEGVTELRTLLTAINSEVRRIQRVTEDYLQFAKMPKPRRDLVSLDELLSQRLPFLHTLIQSARVELVTTWTEALPYVTGDEEQLWQAILNLLRNSLEAMPTGGQLRLHTASVPGAVQLVISDTGKGILPGEMAQIYRPFFSTKPGGTGLGLPLTQQIVAEHGGRLLCDSQPGKGTTFTIELPLTEARSYAETT
jgi:PAS domain S-box-containing protein